MKYILAHSKLSLSPKMWSGFSTSLWKFGWGFIDKCAINCGLAWNCQRISWNYHTKKTKCQFHMFFLRRLKKCTYLLKNHGISLTQWFWIVGFPNRLDLYSIGLYISCNVKINGLSRLTPTYITSNGLERYCSSL